MLDKDQLYDYLNKNQVTYINAVASFLNQYDFNKVPSLKRVIYGGEVLTCNHYKNTFSGRKIVNAYGPTEASIISTMNTTQDYNNGIGMPICNIKCYVLDANLILLPIGAIEELYIGGVGLARGYLNQPELTSEKFVANSFQTVKEKALHKNSR